MLVSKWARIAIYSWRLSAGVSFTCSVSTAWNAEHMSIFNIIDTNSAGSVGRADATVHQTEDF